MTPHWAVNYDPSYPYWVNKIDTVGSGIGWLYSVRDELGDQTPCTNHPEYNEYEGYRNSSYFYDWRIDWSSADGSPSTLGVLLQRQT